MASHWFNLIAGAIVAAELYGIRCPIVLVDRSSFVDIGDWTEISITSEGNVLPGAGVEN